MPEREPTAPNHPGPTQAHSTRSNTPEDVRNNSSIPEEEEGEENEEKEEGEEGEEGDKEEEDDGSEISLIRDNDPALGTDPTPAPHQRKSVTMAGSIRGSIRGQSRRNSAIQEKNGTKDMRIMLLGDRGSGKSTVGNAILKKKVFPVPSYPAPKTPSCQKKTRRVNGWNITVMDTPGLSNSDISDDSHTPEVVRCLTECAPGPHTFVVVLNVQRYQEVEEQEVWNIQDWFGEEAFDYAVVLFTHGDKLGGITIKDFVNKNNHLKDLVEKCGGRYHVLNGKSWRKKGQVKKLLRTIKLMIKQNGGSNYTNETLQVVAMSIDEEAAKITRKTRLSYAEVGKKAIVVVRRKLSHLFVGATTGAILGAMFGISVKVLVFFLKRLGPNLIGYLVALGVPSLVGGAVGSGIIGGALTGGVITGFLVSMTVAGAVVGGAVGAKAAIPATSMKEAMQLAARAVINKEKAGLRKAWDKGVVKHLRSSPEEPESDESRPNSQPSSSQRKPSKQEPIPQELSSLFGEASNLFGEAVASFNLKASMPQLHPKFDKFRRFSLWHDYTSRGAAAAEPDPTQNPEIKKRRATLV